MNKLLISLNECNSDYTGLVKFNSNLDLESINLSNNLNKNINNFINVADFNLNTDVFIRDSLNTSLIGLIPSLSIFNSSIDVDQANELKIYNRRLLTATNNLVLPTTC